MVKLCLQGMDMEEKGKPEEVIRLFQQGWNEAINNFEPWHESRFAGWQVGVELLNKVNQDV